MKKLGDTRKLTRTGGARSLAVTLPANLVRDLGWKEHQKVVIKKVNGALVVRDWRARPKGGKKRK